MDGLEISSLRISRVIIDDISDVAREAADSDKTPLVFMQILLKMLCSNIAANSNRAWQLIKEAICNYTAVCV